MSGYLGQPLISWWLPLDSNTLQLFSPYFIMAASTTTVNLDQSILGQERPGFSPVKVSPFSPVVS